MALSDITRSHVRKAIAEYNRLGEQGFLTKYGFRESRNFLLVHNGSVYPSKAIVGAAHSFVGRQAWGAGNFSGGAPVVAVLTRLGFEVREQPFDDWKLWSKIETHLGELPSLFGGWRRWSEGPHQDLARWPGVYVIGRFGRRPSRVVPCPSGVVYIGMTTRSLRERLDEFEASVQGKPAHSGGWSYRANVAKHLRDAFVAVLPVRLPANQRMRTIGLLEQLLLWSFARRWGRAPVCNSK
jgi:hypothetical protein